MVPYLHEILVSGVTPPTDAILVATTLLPDGALPSEAVINRDIAKFMAISFVGFATVCCSAAAVGTILNGLPLPGK